MNDVSENETPRWLSPADWVIHVFKGVRKTARAIGRSPASVSKWAKSKDRRGSGGLIPANSQRRILEQARKYGLDITEHDLIWGRNLED